MTTRTSLALLLLAACQGPATETGAPTDRRELPPTADHPTDVAPSDPMDPPVDDGYVGPTDWSGSELSEEWQGRLRERALDYGAALRVASLRLRGTLPSLEEQRFLVESPDPLVAYQGMVASFLEDDRFAVQLRAYFSDTFKMGGDPELDSAPLFATQLALEDRPMTELFTATSGTCPALGADGTITPGDCDNGVAVHAGVLTHPGVMRHFYGNLAFRRVRWVQETFACSAFPAEVAEPREVGDGAPYTAPWDFRSIAGAESGGRIDFLDTESVICANCHATMNHLAPLFGRFDDAGVLREELVVTLPSDGNPAVVRGDWLPPGEATAWRIDAPAADLQALGAVLAADPDVARCTVARAHNWAYGRGDIVDGLALVPEEVIEPRTDDYVASGHDFRQLLFDIFTSADFVRF